MNIKKWLHHILSGIRTGSTVYLIVIALSTLLLFHFLAVAVLVCCFMVYNNWAFLIANWHFWLNFILIYLFVWLFIYLDTNIKTKKINKVLDKRRLKKNLK